MMFASRSQLTEGTFLLVVAGGAYTTQYDMEFETLTDTRQARPRESAALGQVRILCALTVLSIAHKIWAAPKVGSSLMLHEDAAAYQHSRCQAVLAPWQNALPPAFWQQYAE